jgi:hypothetical protein
MIDDQDRSNLIKYRLDQSRETVELAKFLIDSGKLTTAVNRIYYGIFYAITALAIRYSFETSKHGQLIGWFNKEFIATNILDKRLGKILRNAYQNRTKGDYDVFIAFNVKEVELMHSEMKDFIDEIEKFLKSS